ncbi:hypothetical protein TNCV_3582461 [Trichonephila clavipes]|nr:hypothetical protein TNCV_3582461 [Trichonephila clavipes]
MDPIDTGENNKEIQAPPPSLWNVDGTRTIRSPPRLVGEMDSRKPFSPTSSGSRTIPSWSLTSSTGV